MAHSQAGSPETRAFASSALALDPSLILGVIFLEGHPGSADSTFHFGMYPKGTGHEWPFPRHFH